MAQVDIGKIKIVWKGAWDSSTAYTVDDAVSHSGNSYICIQAGTNQNPSSATAYWQIMASAGTNGTDADLLNIASTAQGDIYYNNGSAIARLAPGTSGQFLKTLGANANPAWGSVVAGLVQVVTAVDTSATSASGTSWSATTTSVNITPTSASNKIFVIVNSILDSAASSQQSGATIFRDSTNLGSNNHGMAQTYTGGDRTIAPCSMHVLDSPNTTSQITYKVYVNENGSQNVEWNGQSTHAHITAMEVAV